MKQVVVIGAGPAGCAIANWCSDIGFKVVVVERATEKHIYRRDKAGLFKASSFTILEELGLSECAPPKKIVSKTCFVAPSGEPIIVPLTELTQRSRPVCPQADFNRNLIGRLRQKNVPIYFNEAVVELTQTAEKVTVKLANGSSFDADFVLGCDGSRGITGRLLCLQSITYDLPYKWLVMSAAPPVGSAGVIYGVRPGKFACHSPRTATESRYYLQIPLEDEASDWSGNACARELQQSLGVEDSFHITEKREMTLRYQMPKKLGEGRVMVAGDAAHIVAPMGGQGMNMALEDVYALSKLFVLYSEGVIRAREMVQLYEKMRLKKIEKSMRFSRNLLAMTHGDKVDALHALSTNKQVATTFAHNYVGTDEVIDPL